MVLTSMDTLPYSQRLLVEIFCLGVPTEPRTQHEGKIPKIEIESLVVLTSMQNSTQIKGLPVERFRRLVEAQIIMNARENPEGICGFLGVIINS